MRFKSPMLGIRKWKRYVVIASLCRQVKCYIRSVIFARIEYKYKVDIHFIEARFRIAPKEKATIPRLELLGASVGARLMNKVASVLNINTSNVLLDRFFNCFDIDSKRNKMSYFVWNRVQEIQSQLVELTLRLRTKEEFFGRERSQVERPMHIQRWTRLLRTKNLIANRQDTLDFHYPIVLDSHHPIVSKLIEHTHWSLNHTQTEITINHLRKQYWITRR